MEPQPNGPKTNLAILARHNAMEFTAIYTEFPSLRELYEADVPLERLAWLTGAAKNLNIMLTLHPQTSKEAHPCGPLEDIVRKIAGFIDDDCNILLENQDAAALLAYSRLVNHPPHKIIQEWPLIQLAGKVGTLPFARMLADRLRRPIDDFYLEDFATKLAKHIQPKLVAFAQARIKDGIQKNLKHR